MARHSGVREVDIARREDSIVSWLGSREHMTGKELAAIFTDGMDSRYQDPSFLMTTLALERLVERKVVNPTEMKTFFAFSLVDRHIADDIDPATVELAPRELALINYIDMTRPNPRPLAEIEASFDVNDGPEPWQTMACLRHLANIGLIHTIGEPPHAYRLPEGSV